MKKRISQGLLDMMNVSHDEIENSEAINYEPIYKIEKDKLEAKIKKRTDACDECDMMANYEDPDKWDVVKKCPKCKKSTAILKKGWI